MFSIAVCDTYKVSNCVAVIKLTFTEISTEGKMYRVL